MAASDHVDLPTFIEGVKRRNPGQPEFCQAVQEVSEDNFDFIKDKQTYLSEQILRRIAQYADEYTGSTFHAADTPWKILCDVALPCASQNALLGDDAQTLIKNGCVAVSECANIAGFKKVADSMLAYGVV